MVKLIDSSKIYLESFRVNLYTIEPFRVIGLIDVDIEYDDGIERVILPFFRSSGTNSGKIRGLWYPIVGIKLYDGNFTEFTDYINHVLTNTTRDGIAMEGWLAKSLFFSKYSSDKNIIRGFSNGEYYNSLLDIGEKLRTLYKAGEYKKMYTLDSIALNNIVTENKVYYDNNHTQRDNFEKYIKAIYDNWKMYWVQKDVTQIID